MPATVFPTWQAGHTALARAWPHAPGCLPHALHRHPLFEREALAALIERCPASHGALVHTNRQSGRAVEGHGDGGAAGPRRWREGDRAGVPGHRVIEAIGRHSLWLNLRDVGAVDPRYAALLRAAYDEMAAHLPGFAPRSLKLGILISSPGARVHYHCDLPGQTLWQIEGRKRVYVYPNAPPYLQPQALEDIAYSGHEFKLAYDSAYDAAAQVIELAPGQMLSWPLNAPHRVENHDELNISLTTEHWTEANRRSQRVLLANAVLRHRLGWAARSQAVSGPGYWAKAALAAAWRRSPWAARTQAAERPLTFRLDPDAPEGCVDLPP